MTNRRGILKGTIATAMIPPSTSSAAPLHVGMLTYPKLTQLDLAGPFEVFSRMSNTRIHLLWKTMQPVTSDGGLPLLPTMTLEECPALDVVFVPGGFGQIALMDDAVVLDFLAKQGVAARFVTSVCTGSLVLGAAGLLKGYRAACHWMSRDQLTLLGAVPVAERVVVDRNRITGGGVTAGIDFGLTLAALLHGDAEAERIQLQIEYNPEPPFHAGSPESADPHLVVALKKRFESILAARREATLRAKARIEQHRH